MIEPAFADKSKLPTPTQLSKALGKAAAAWTLVAAHAIEAFPGADPVWKHYGARHGWQWVVRSARRNVLYLKPGTGVFTAMLALNDKGVKEVQASDLPAGVVAEIVGARKLPEGRAARLDVKSPKDAALMNKLIDIKQAS